MKSRDCRTQIGRSGFWMDIRIHDAKEEASSINFCWKCSIVVRAELAGRGILSPKKEKDEFFDRQICLLYSVSSFGAIVCRSPIYPFKRRRSSFTICIQPVTPTWPPSAFPSRGKALRANCTPPNIQQPHIIVIRCFLLRLHRLILKTTYLSNTFIHRASPFLSAWYYI